MQYKILDRQSVKEFLIEIENIKEFLGVKSLDELDSLEIGDGNLNFVFVVTSKIDKTKSLIVKQAVPYLRCVGESFPLSRDRMTYEIRALLKYEELAKDFVPKIYYSSEQMSVVVMQNLSSHIILRKGLIKKNYYHNFIEHITTFVANTLFHTSSLSLNSTSKRALIDNFNSNTELCKLTENFVFGFAFMENETNNINEDLKDEAKEFFASNGIFKKNVLELKYMFMTQSDALLHGDFHTGSVMVNEGDTYVIDPEFAFVGPFGFDIGALIANMINAYIAHSVVSDDERYQEKILDSIREFYKLFEEKFLSLWNAQSSSALIEDNFIDDEYLDIYKSEFMHNIFSSSIGFAGCKITRRVFGVAGVEEIRGIEDDGLRKEAELKALKTKLYEEYELIIKQNNKHSK
jgi:5-methylthioribose kinase